jgi:hypothetical protein
MALDAQYNLIGEKLHEALLALPATKADAALHIINTGGLSLPQAGVEKAIDAIIDDLADQLVLTSADYATLLARHQAADPVAALRELSSSARISVLRYDTEVSQARIDDATSQYLALSQAQKDAIDDIKSVADEGIIRIGDYIGVIAGTVADLEAQRDLR